MKQDDIKTLVDRGILQKHPDHALWEDELRELQRTGFLQSQPDRKGFAFSNNLTWEVVYETLLYAERRRLHSLVARHMEKYNADQLDSVAGLLLYHFEAAQVYNKCVLYGALAGDRAAAMYANADAIDFYGRVLTALDACAKPYVVDRSLVYERMGDVHETAGHHQKAVDALQQSLDLWSYRTGKRSRAVLVPWTFRNSVREAELCRKIAVSCERQSDYDRSLEWLDEASRRLPARPGRVASKVSASRSVTLFRKGEYQEGIQWGKRALKSARRSGERADVAYAHNMLANSYIETGQLQKSIEHLSQAVEYYGELADYPGIAAANSNLASCYGFFGNLDASIEHFTVALEADERMQNGSSIAIDHQNIGHVLALRGRLDEAIGHLQQVAKMDEEGRCRPDLAGAAYIDLCQCMLDKGDKAAAEELLDKGLALLKRSGQSGLIMDAELQLAELRLALDEPQQAHDLCAEVLERIRKLDAKLYEVRAERVLGVALSKLGKTNEALSHLQDSVRIANEIGADHEKARSLVSLAHFKLEHQIDTSAASREQLDQAIEIFSNMGAELELVGARRIRDRYFGRN